MTTEPSRPRAPRGPISWGPLLRRVGARPASVLGASLLATLLFAGVVLLVFEGELEWYLLYYFVPIGLPFVAHVLERARRWPTLGRQLRCIEGVTVGLALARAVCPIPFFSGHALFLTYALLTTSDLLVRILAGLILLEVVYIKAFVWHDLTLVGGILLGVAASIAYGRFARWPAAQ